MKMKTLVPGGQKDVYNCSQVRIILSLTITTARADNASWVLLLYNLDNKPRVYFQKGDLDSDSIEALEVL